MQYLVIMCVVKDKINVCLFLLLNLVSLKTDLSRDFFMMQICMLKFRLYAHIGGKLFVILLESDSMQNIKISILLQITNYMYLWKYRIYIVPKFFFVERTSEKEEKVAYSKATNVGLTCNINMIKLKIVSLF